VQTTSTAGISGQKPKLLWLAGLLSFIVPGSGLFYLRRSLRGVFWLAVFAIVTFAVVRFGATAPSQLIYWASAIVSALAVVDTTRIGQRLEKGELQRESDGSTVVAVAGAACIALVAAGAFWLSTSPLDRAERGTILFARSVDTDFRLTGQTDHFAPRESFAFAARLRHRIDAGATVMLVFTKRSDAGDIVFLRQSITLPAQGDLLRAPLSMSTAGSYALQIVSANGTEAEGAFVIGTFN